MTRLMLTTATLLRGAAAGAPGGWAVRCEPSQAEPPTAARADRMAKVLFTVRYSLTRTSVRYAVFRAAHRQRASWLVTEGAGAVNPSTRYPVLSTQCENTADFTTGLSSAYWLLRTLTFRAARPCGKLPPFGRPWWSGRPDSSGGPVAVRTTRALAVLLALAAGCSGSADRGAAVSGRVTRNGQPL